MQGTDQRAESGGMNAGITYIGAELRLHIAKGQIFPYNTQLCETLDEQFTVSLPEGGCGMKAKSERFSIALFNTAVAVSAVTMIWLLWHFPIVTVASALIVAGLVALVANLTKTLDAEPSSDVSQPKPNA
jgi:hypothetical protein